MGLFTRKKAGFAPVDTMRESERDSEIDKLERERLRINTEIEQVLKNYAKESGNRKLRRRRHKMGKSPNDYGFGKK